MEQRRPILYIVHCIDTEGPLTEDLEATFGRLLSIFGINLSPSVETLIALQNKKIDLGGIEEAVAKCFAPELLKYNTNWDEISSMLDVVLSADFRRKMTDDFGNGWVYSWHCMDHIGYFDNPRHKDVGYGNIFRFYKSKLAATGSVQDEINWHFHPLSLLRNPIHAATSFINSYDVLIQILCRRILDDGWFPVVNRPGFHSERPDSHAFLEQWIPFDYANQYVEQEEDQPDVSNGRFGDWNRAPKSWRGYHPSHEDYQNIGWCNRMIFRCLNVGTRLRALTIDHVRAAFLEAKVNDGAILSFADHDYRDIRKDVDSVRDMLRKVRDEFPDVLLKFCGAEDAAINLLGYNNQQTPVVELELNKNRLIVKLIAGEIFGPQPFLAIKTKEGHYYHDNLDVIIPKREWTYVFDEQTLYLNNIEKVGIGTAGKYGKSASITISRNISNK